MLSVITPIFNGASFVLRCYHMLKLQSVQNWEWVVVDDGSTDETVKLLRGISDPRVRVIHYSPNKGRGFARSTALREARGDWMVVWDIDDLYFPDRLAHVERARQNAYDFCCSYAALVDNDLSLRGVRGFHLDFSRTTMLFVHPTLACRLDLARSIGYDASLPAGEDAAMILTLSRRHKGLWIEDALIGYQEEREVNLDKAILSNQGQLRLAKELYGSRVLDIGRKKYASMVIRWHAKLAILHLLRLYPSIYPRTVQLREKGTTREGWNLSGEHAAFIREMRAEFSGTDLHNPGRRT